MKIYQITLNILHYGFKSMLASQFFHFASFEIFIKNFIFCKTWASSPEGSAPFLELKIYKNLYSINTYREKLVRSQMNYGIFRSFHSNVKKARIGSLTKKFATSCPAHPNYSLRLTLTLGYKLYELLRV